MVWLPPFLRIRSARLRVGRMFWRQVGKVDGFPGPEPELVGFLGAHLAEAMEEALRVGEGGFPQPGEALHEPAPQICFVGVDVDGKIEEVGGKQDRLSVLGQFARLQNVQPFDNQDVGPVDDGLLARDHVIDQVRVDRHADIRLAGLDVGKEGDEAGAVIAFGKPLRSMRACALPAPRWTAGTRRW